MEADNQTIVSELTDTNDSDIIMSNELEQKLQEIRLTIENKLNELNIDGLKDKCKELGIGGVSKYKKPELVATLSAEFSKFWGSLKEKKANELKSNCKMCNIKGLAGLKKDVIIVSILQYYSNFTINWMCWFNGAAYGNC